MHVQADLSFTFSFPRDSKMLCAWELALYIVSEPQLAFSSGPLFSRCSRRALGSNIYG